MNNVHCHNYKLYAYRYKLDSYCWNFTYLILNGVSKDRTILLKAALKAWQHHCESNYRMAARMPVSSTLHERTPRENKRVWVLGAAACRVA